MSDAPKKRPWFQFHLSTAIVMMFVASGMMWANFRVTRGFALCELPFDPTDPSSPPKSFSVHVLTYGWPASCRTAACYEDGTTEPWNWVWHWGAFILDAASAVALLAVTATLCEWRIRRGQSTDHGQLTTDN